MIDLKMHFFLGSRGLKCDRERSRCWLICNKMFGALYSFLDREKWACKVSACPHAHSDGTRNPLNRNFVHDYLIE